MDLSAKSENMHCPLFFTPRWHHAGQQLGCMHFLRSRNVGVGVTLVLWEIREERASVILIAPNQPGFPDLTELLEAPPWPIPGRKHMLSQVDGSVWHSNLELWSHHVCSLQGYQRRWAPYSLACLHAHGSANTPMSFWVLWWVYEGPSRIETKSVTLDCGCNRGGIYNPRFGKCPLHIRGHSTRVITPPEHGQEVCVFKIFAWQPVGLRRIPSAGFTSWTFSP